MRIGIYCRKSTESEDRQVQSLEDQLAAMKAVAERENWSSFELFAESKSAKAPGTRPEFERLLREIEEGRIQGILTWNIDRLARNPVDGGRVSYALQLGQLRFIRTPERTYRPEDNALLMSIETGMATAYVQSLSRNVARGMDGKAERGWLPAKAPLGYLNDPETREILPDPARFDLVRSAWDELISGASTVGQIHRRLVARGLTVRTRRRTPKPPSRAAIHLMFRDPFYAGSFRWKGRTYAGKHKPMLTPDEFARAKDVLDGRSWLKPSAPEKFPAAAAFRCYDCGCAVVGEAKEKRYPRSGRTARYVYYHCSGAKGCPKVSANSDRLREFFEKVAYGIRLPRATAEWLADSLAEAEEREGTADAAAIAALKSRIEAAAKRHAALLDMRMDGELTKEEFQAAKEALDEQAASARRELEKLESARFDALRDATDRVMAASDFCEGVAADPLSRVVATAAKKLGEFTLNLGEPLVVLHPVIQKIAAFEPLRNGSEMPKRGDLLPLNSVWWGLVEDIRTSSKSKSEMYH